MKRNVLMTILISMTLALSAFSTQAQSDQICFDAVEYCIAGRIAEFWQQNGGLPVFGFPIGPQQEMRIEGQPVTVQWFERNRLELHPENAPPYDVLLGRLGVNYLEQQGRDWQSFPTDGSAQEGCAYFEQTGQNVCGEILALWQSNGLELDGVAGITPEESLALFGLPISPVMPESINNQEYQVQWFERARFELHPQNAPPYNVLLGLLGTEVAGSTPTDTIPATMIDLGNGLTLVSRQHEEEIADPQFTLTTNVPYIEGTADEPAITFNKAVDGLVREETREFAASIADIEQFPDQPPYSLWIDHEVVTTDNGVISVHFTVSTYTGGAHPNHISRVINFDMVENQVLLLSELFTAESDYLTVIAAYCISELSTRQDIVFDDFEAGAAPTEQNYYAWNIDETGLRITFDPYQVAPYAAGMQQVTVPYPELQDIIHPDSVLTRVITN